VTVETGSFSPLEVAERLADDLLFPTALATDQADRVPRRILDALAVAGLYGLYGPAEAGGLGCDQATGLQVVEILAGACLSTTFVWIQHHSTVRAVAACDIPGIRERWLEPLCRGKWRAGIAVAGIRPGTSAVSAVPVDGGWIVNGDVPWVTGWGLIDVLRTAARGPEGEVVWALIDAVESATLTVDRLSLVAVQSSVTVTVRFRHHFVPDERVMEREEYDDWLAHDVRGMRRNGSLALGVIGRCCRLLGPGPLDAELADCRDALDRAADPEALARARAAASALAVRAAAALVVASGSRAVLLDQHPQRLAREAMFLLVFASRPAIRKELLPRFGGLG